MTPEQLQIPLAKPEWVGRRAMAKNDHWLWYEGKVASVTEDGQFVEIESESESVFRFLTRRWTESIWFASHDVHLIA